MDGLLPLWIIGSVLVLAIVDRLNIGKSSTTLRHHQTAYSEQNFAGT